MPTLRLNVQLIQQTWLKLARALVANMYNEEMVEVTYEYDVLGDGGIVEAGNYVRTCIQSALAGESSLPRPESGRVNGATENPEQGPCVVTFTLRLFVPGTLNNYEYLEDYGNELVGDTDIRVVSIRDWRGLGDGIVRAVSGNLFDEDDEYEYEYWDEEDDEYWDEDEE